jgi:hypothetical protein
MTPQQTVHLRCIRLFHESKIFFIGQIYRAEIIKHWMHGDAYRVQSPYHPPEVVPPFDFPFDDPMWEKVDIKSLDFITSET